MFIGLGSFSFGIEKQTGLIENKTLKEQIRMWVRYEMKKIKKKLVQSRSKCLTNRYNFFSVRMA